MSTRKDFSVVALSYNPPFPKTTRRLPFPFPFFLFSFFFFVIQGTPVVHPPTHTHSHALTFDRTRLSIAEFISFRISPVIVLLYLTFSAFSTPSLPLTSTSVHRFLSLPPSSKKRLPSVERPLHPPTITDPCRSSSSNPRVRKRARSRSSPSSPHFVSLFSSARLYR